MTKFLKLFSTFIILAIFLACSNKNISENLDENATAILKIKNLNENLDENSSKTLPQNHTTPNIQIQPTQNPIKVAIIPPEIEHQYAIVTTNKNIIKKAKIRANKDQIVAILDGKREISESLFDKTATKIAKYLKNIYGQKSKILINYDLNATTIFTKNF